MIKYALKCSFGHEFESWFASAQAFDDLRARKLTTCVVCGDPAVEKAMMAPRVRGETTLSPDRAKSSDPSTPMAISPNEAAMAQLRAAVEANSDYVGKDFASKAREMHEGQTVHRSIYGEAKPQEARALLEDGVPVLPLPFTPKNKSN